MPSLLTVLKPKTSSEKMTRTVVDTILVTPTIVKQWKAPPFQRPVRENDKVRALAEKLKIDDGVWPGIVTLGVLAGETFLLGDRDRSPAYQRIKASFVERLRDELGTRVMLPAPPWSPSK